MAQRPTSGLQPLTRRWSDLMHQLQVENEAASDAARKELFAHYREPRRAYHDLTHIADCQAHLDAWTTTHPAQLPTRELAALEAAIWYHDVIYDTHRHDNEAASAQWFAAAAARLALYPDFVSQVESLIRITDHKQSPSRPIESLLISIDLAILGAAPSIYRAYASAVRREYGWVPEADYHSGRTQVLQAFLDHPTIYPEPWFRERYEAKARLNLAAELERLKD